MSDIQATNFEFVKKSKRITKPLPPGARVQCRDSEWIVRNCSFDMQLNSYVVNVEGTSGFVEGIEATFLDALDEIKIVDPLDIKFVPDDSGEFLKTKLFLDLWLRKAIPVTNSLAIGHKAAIKSEKFQNVAAFKALDEEKHLRPRVLIADAVGLGKTIQVGILMSELIKRQRGKRILVVCLKSMALQFQKEIWSRFAIPLKMIDSKEVEKVFKEIPGNMNPLNYFDRAIISMDTLKTNVMMTYLDKTHWDIVVIDECHNVARRGKGSGRSKLARKLSSICDSLILTSATPHDGKKRSYGSLLELIDPTIVINPEDVTKEDLEKVAVRRFHKDVQLDQKIPPRVEHPKYVQLSSIEEEILTELKHAEFESFTRSSKDYLFRTTLSKALYSSPSSFLSVLNNRLGKLKEKSIHDTELVEKLISMAEGFGITDSPKYKQLINTIKALGKKDRIVIFTESKATQLALKESLSKELNLKIHDNDRELDKKSNLVVLHAGLPEKTQQDIVESFASEDSSIKILLATDVASEGINLHYYCNNLIHYDVPWSLITLEQRNGRIDRYGQTEQPNIYYIVGESQSEELSKFNERWVVDKLLEKLNNVRDQLGDEGLAMALFDPEKEVEAIKEKFEEEEDLDDLFLSDFEDADVFGSVQDVKNEDVRYQENEKIFTDEQFLNASLDLLKIKRSQIENGADIPLKDNNSFERFFQQSLRNLSKELELGNEYNLVLSNNLELMDESIAESRKSAGTWPDKQYLWEINPVFQSLLKRIDGTFESDEVLVSTLSPDVNIDQQTPYFVVHGSITNKLGQPEISEIKIAHIRDGKLVFSDAIKSLSKLGLIGKQIPNIELKINGRSKELRAVIKDIIGQYDQSLYAKGTKIHEERKEKFNQYKDEITKWRDAKLEYLKERHKSRKRTREEEISLVNQTYARYLDYIEGKFNVQSEHPYIRPLAVIYSKEVLND